MDALQTVAADPTLAEAFAAWVQSLNHGTRVVGGAGLCALLARIL